MLVDQPIMQRHGGWGDLTKSDRGRDGLVVQGRGFRVPGSRDEATGTSLLQSERLGEAVKLTSSALLACCGRVYQALIFISRFRPEKAASDRNVCGGGGGSEIGIPDNLSAYYDVLNRRR